MVAFQAISRGFESRLPLQSAHVAQAAERVLGKDEVTSSNLVVGSRLNGPDLLKADITILRIAATGKTGNKKEQ